MRKYIPHPALVTPHTLTVKAKPQIPPDVQVEVKAYFSKLQSLNLDTITPEEIVAAFEFPAYKYGGFDYNHDANGCAIAVVSPLNKLLMHADFARLSPLQLLKVVDCLVMMKWPLNDSVKNRFLSSLSSKANAPTKVTISEYIMTFNLFLKHITSPGNRNSLDEKIIVLESCASTFTKLQSLTHNTSETLALQQHKEKIKALLQSVFIKMEIRAELKNRLLCIAKVFGVDLSHGKHQIPPSSPPFLPMHTDYSKTCFLSTPELIFQEEESVSVISKAPESMQLFRRPG